MKKGAETFLFPGINAGSGIRDFYLGDPGFDAEVGI